MVIGPINLPVGRLFEEVITECRRRWSLTGGHHLAFPNGPVPCGAGRGPQQGGTELSPKYIPAEVFLTSGLWTRARWSSTTSSFVEALPRYDKKNKLAVSIELSDFSVYYA